jgi:hypothetical protein
MKTLLISRLGDHSLHKQWLREKERDWVFWGSYFGDTQDKYLYDCDYYEEVKGPKFPIVKKLIKSRWDEVKQFDRVWIVDDDLLFNPLDIPKFVATAEKYDLWVAQPGLDRRGCTGYKALVRDIRYVIHYVNIIEGMAPLFSIDALEKVLPVMDQVQSGWGLGLAYWHVLGKPDKKIAVVDEMCMLHTRPAGTGELYATLREMHINWQAELELMEDRYKTKNEPQILDVVMRKPL